MGSNTRRALAAATSVLLVPKSIAKIVGLSVLKQKTLPYFSAKRENGRGSNLFVQRVGEMTSQRYLRVERSGGLRGDAHCQLLARWLV